MKTYILDSLERFKRFSKSLDIITDFCNKTWILFDDSGDRILYIFKDDKEVLITKNGVGQVACWEWVSANNTIVIKENANILMFVPQFVDDVILSLQLYGTNSYVFLIEENNTAKFLPHTLKDLGHYFEEKERLYLLQKEKEKQKRNEQERQIEERKILEQEQRKKEQEKIAWEKNVRNPAEAIVSRGHELCQGC